MRFLGCRYARSEQHRSAHLEAVLVAAEPAAAVVDDPFMVQFHLLHAIALFWTSHETRARESIGTAIDMAVRLGMHTREFAMDPAHNEEGDLVLAESWRRTWWQLVIVEGAMAATMRTFSVRVARVADITADLPCEEAQYENGKIPPPKTLEDFSNREFIPDDDGEGMFSSFAYLINVTRNIIALASMDQSSMPHILPPWQMLNELNAIVNAWLLLLPEEKKTMVTAEGEIDELMFQAHMSVHSTIIGLHRPFSDLIFNPLELISSCSSLPPEHRPPLEAQAIHTARVMASIEAQMRLLSLPLALPSTQSRFSSQETAPLVSTPALCAHSPFVTCMISTGTVPLLSACVSLYKTPEQSHKLSQARNHIRLSIGCMKSFADVWPRGQRNLREVQSIARHVLGVGGAAPSSTEESGATSTRQPARTCQQQISHSNEETLAVVAANLSSGNALGEAECLAVSSGDWRQLQQAIPSSSTTPDCVDTVIPASGVDNWSMPSLDLTADSCLWFSQYPVDIGMLPDHASDAS
ncbi:hypothetical protein Micbo1qcDRAFT_236418 [Microdochium bolleyi]|uniref:Xylanolytic transcriptional activator regulatory domain-containing protein n=1 Tax=Microdochium bolleyi TaxID=196109 RepID=A0A136IRL6_9PEZI|nr:hypothetical protein Micbo1qcDRAFT_236418 [Microdochium bolleyi]